MRSHLSVYSALLFLFSFIFLPLPTLAADDELGDEYEETARVARVSLMKGEVSLRRAGEIEWETAQLNVPLVEGDVIGSGKESHFEIQIDARNFVRVGENAVLKIVTLRNEGIALSLSEGSAILRLARFDPDKEYFEIDAPLTTLAAEKRGLYRIDVARDGSVRVTVREDGRARIYSEDSGFVLRNNRTAKLILDAQNEGDWEFTSALALDDWDFWNDEREKYLAARLRYDGRDRYYDNEVWGAEELDLYGDWTYTRDYGYLWRPHTTIITHYHDWAPYRHGHWRWCPPYGWTWIPDEPWGWAPYHYGRWVYYNNGWCWAPRGYGYAYRRAWWRPALVAFIYIPTRLGEHIAWYPLTHGQRDPRGRHWGRNRDGFGNNNRYITGTRPANPAFLRAVSTMSTREFGVSRVRGKMATTDIAQRALRGDPVPGRLPVPGPGGAKTGTAERFPAKGTVASGSSTTGKRPVLNIERPAPIGPTRELTMRETGAAKRAPGIPLENELRRLKVFNSREPKAISDGPNAGGEVNTGVITRPSKVSRRPGIEKLPSNDDPPGESKSGSRLPRAIPKADSNGDPSLEPRIRQPKQSDGNEDSPSPRPKVRPRMETEPTFPPSDDPQPKVRRPAPDESPKSQPRREDSEPSYRPVRPTPREDPPPPRQEQPTPPPRYEAPPPRYEKPAPPPRYEQPAPKQEQPKESPRHEQPPPPPRDKPSERPLKGKPDSD